VTVKQERHIDGWTDDETVIRAWRVSRLAQSWLTLNKELSYKKLLLGTKKSLDM
jgi:hypothetical protein